MLINSELKNKESVIAENSKVVVANGDMSKGQEKIMNNIKFHLFQNTYICNEVIYITSLIRLSMLNNLT